MLKSLLIFLLMGFVWLFIFSIPVGTHGKKVFHLGYFYFVDTKFIHSLTGLVSKTAHQTENKANDVLDDVVHKMEQKNSP